MRGRSVSGAEPAGQRATAQHEVSALMAIGEEPVAPRLRGSVLNGEKHPMRHSKRTSTRIAGIARLIRTNFLVG
jgi:hypothetical protein